MSDPPLENFCPFCGNPNHCAVNAPGGCWCGRIEIPMELIERLPEIGKSCICLACVESYTRDPAGFGGITQTKPA